MKYIREYIPITGGAVITAAAIFFFLQPSGLITGSITGLAILLGNFIPLSIAALTFILNLILLAIGFLLLGREFGTKTVYTSLAIPVFMGVFEGLFPGFRSILGDPVLDLICCLFLCGLGQSILFSCNASSGGTDIIGKILQKYLRMDLGKAVAAAGMVIAATSFLVYDLRTAVLSILGTYLSGIILDHFIFGADTRRRVCIISQQHEALLDFILKTLRSGATLYEAKGAYTGAVQTEIIVLVDKSEYRKLMDAIARIDPAAFVAVYNIHEVMYKPKKFD